MLFESMSFPYYISVLAAFALTVVMIFVLDPVARHIGLVDQPNHRKKHDGAIPLVGGIAMFVALSFAVLTLDFSIGWLRALFAGSLLLIVVGVLDDLRELSPTIRFTAQIIATGFMALWGGVVLHDFGHLVSSGFILETGILAVPVTIFAAIGVINALNMLDGVDGLAGLVSLVSVIGMAIVAYAAGQTNILLMLGLVLAVLIGFLIFNMRFNRPQALIFMGDAGSMFIGFLLSWFFIMLSQGESRAMSPVIALWLFAVPLMETLTMMIRRVRHGRSPFSADREHLHHMLEMAGFSCRGTLSIIVLAAVFFAAIGLVGHFMQVPEPVMFYSFLALFGAYFWMIMRSWKVMRFLKRNLVSE